MSVLPAKRSPVQAPPKPAPLPLWQALLLFGIPAVLFRIVLYNGTGFLVMHGVSESAAVITAFLIPSVLLLLATFVAVRLDGYKLSWSMIQDRFRFRPMTWRSWLWVVGGALFALVGEQLLAFTGALLVRIPIFTPPSYLSFLNPTVRQSLTSFLGVPLRGNWVFFVLFTGLVVVQVVAEECWWRGYIFPRQEQVYGKWTWPMHGVLWTVFHVIFYPWNVVVDLFFCTTVAFIVQRTKNTWVSLFIHLQDCTPPTPVLPCHDSAHYALSLQLRLRLAVDAA
ncbi:MAG: CPBP family intramembrane glutamic endopeptidase [Ktedonobacterales bacterium]